MTWYIGNAFALSMLQGSGTLRYQRASIEEVRRLVAETRPISFMGHADIARLVSQELAVYDVPVNRINVRLQPGDNVIVAQYMGARLPEGAKQLPEGARIDYYLVAVGGGAEK